MHEDDVERIKKLAKYHHRTFSSMVRVMLISSIPQWEKVKKDDDESQVIIDFDPTEKNFGGVINL